VVTPDPLTSANAGDFPFAAVALAGVDVTCATAYLLSEDESPAGERLLGVLVWASDVPEWQLEEVTHLAVALGYVMTEDGAPIETAANAEGAESSPGEGEVPPSSFSRRLDVPESNDAGFDVDPGVSGPPGTSLLLEYYPAATPEASAGLAITFSPGTP
jgi:hypothetical protein